MSHTDFYWYDPHCGFNADPEYFLTKLGVRWVCKGCGVNGFRGQYGEPKPLPDSELIFYENCDDLCKDLYFSEKVNEQE